jgi:hypothetical protein
VPLRVADAIKHNHTSQVRRFTKPQLPNASHDTRRVISNTNLVPTRRRRYCAREQPSTYSTTHLKMEAADEGLPCFIAEMPDELLLEIASHLTVRRGFLFDETMENGASSPRLDTDLSQVPRHRNTTSLHIYRPASRTYADTCFAALEPAQQAGRCSLYPVY